MRGLSGVIRLLLFGIALICLALIFRPFASVQDINQNYNENKILIEYEIFGCGSLVVRVIEGGKEIADVLIAEYPNVAQNEVKFTKNSDEPYLHLDSADFYTAGLARGYQYIVEGEVTGITQGAQDCCSFGVAHSEVVPEFLVHNWYALNYMPYYKYSAPVIWYFLIIVAGLCLVGIIISFIICGKNNGV